jgi:hypothetical protein
MSAFLFEETFSMNLSKVTLVRPSLNQPFSFRITSNTVLNYAIHFIGTALVCPGAESCPACGTIGKRVLSLLVGGSNLGINLLEVGQPTMAEMAAIKNQHSMMTLKDSTWSFVRLKAKRPLIPTLVQVQSEKPSVGVADQSIMRAFSKLFNLPAPQQHHDIESYQQYVQDSMIKKLKSALV